MVSASRSSKVSEEGPEDRNGNGVSDETFPVGVRRPEVKTLKTQVSRPHPTLHQDR